MHSPAGMNTTPPPSPCNGQGIRRRKCVSKVGHVACPRRSTHLVTQVVLHATSDAEVAAAFQTAPPLQGPPTPPEQSSPSLPAKQNQATQRFNTRPETRCDESISSDEVSPPEHRNGGRSYQGFKLANAIVGNLPQQLGSVKVLLELQRDLERARLQQPAGQRSDKSQCRNCACARKKT